METVRCNYCGSDSYDEIHRLPDFMLGKDQFVTLVQCRRCGLVYQNPRLTAFELQAHYPPDYESYQAASPEVGRRGRIAARIRGFGQRKRARIVARLKAGGRILDVGCASGAFLSALPLDWERYGVETNAGAAEAGRKAGLDIFHGTLEEANFPGQHFDAVTLWDVLEHLPDPAGSLLEIHRILKPDGIVIIRVPNRDSWEARIFGRYWAGLDAPRHMFVFDLESLQKMLAKAGFSPGKRTQNVGLYPAFLLSVRFWIHADPARAARLQWVMRLLENPVTRLLAAPWFYWIGKSRRAGWVILAASKVQSRL